MSLILKGIDLPEPIKGFRTHIELYVRSDGVVFDDDFEEVGRAIQIPKGHGNIKDVDKIKLMARLGEVDIDRIDEAPTILDKERE